PDPGVERAAQAGPDRLRPAREPDLAATTRPSDRPLPGPKREGCRPRRAERLRDIGGGARVKSCGWRIQERRDATRIPLNDRPKQEATTIGGWHELGTVFRRAERRRVEDQIP